MTSLTAFVCSTNQNVASTGSGTWRTPPVLRQFWVKRDRGEVWGGQGMTSLTASDCSTNQNVANTGSGTRQGCGSVVEHWTHDGRVVCSVPIRSRRRK